MEAEKKTTGTKDSKSGCLVILVLIAASVLLGGIFYVWESRPISSIDDAFERVYGKNNVSKLEYYEALETMPSRLNAHVLIKASTEEQYNRYFAEKAVEICRLLSSVEDIDEVFIAGYTKYTDAKGNNQTAQQVNFLSTKELRSGVNWDSFKEMVMADYSRITTIGELSK